MHEHGPDPLFGPVRGTAAWWRGMGAQPDATDEGTPIPEQPRKKRKDARPIRTELVERVRKEIAQGTYDTQERWEAALDCLLDGLQRED
jgi:Anti-sigma-28 factor, FlgM